MPYEPYENIESGEAPNTIRGLLPFDESGARAFGYDKFVTINVPPLVDRSNPRIDLAGFWHVRIRDSPAKIGEEYTGAILFEQKVTLVAEIIYQDFGGIVLLIWKAKGVGGKGNQETSIVDGISYATVGNPSDPAQAERRAAYAQSGAWRALDQRITEDGTPEDKYGREGGDSQFDDATGVTVGGDYSLSLTWTSANYKCEIPQGAIWEIVRDTWQSSVIETALYRITWDKGSAQDRSLFQERSGERLWVQNDTVAGAKQVRVHRSRKPLSPIPDSQVEVAGPITTEALKGATLFPVTGGMLLALGKLASKIAVYESNDRGKSWKKIMETDSNLTILASCLTRDATRMLAYGKDGSGAAAYAILKRDNTGWILSETGKAVGPNLPTKGISSMTPTTGGAVRLLVRESSIPTGGNTGGGTGGTGGTGGNANAATTSGFRTLVSSDGGKTYKDEVSGAEANPATTPPTTPPVTPPAGGTP